MLCVMVMITVVIVIMIMIVVVVVMIVIPLISCWSPSNWSISSSLLIAALRVWFCVRIVGALVVVGMIVTMTVTMTVIMATLAFLDR